MDCGDTGQGPVRLGVDFGTDTTVIVLDDPGRDYPSVAPENLSRELPGSGSRSPARGIPSVIRYHDDGRASLGCEAAGHDEPESATARNLPRYIGDSSPVRLPAGNGRTVRYEDAARDFLQGVLSRVTAAYPGGVDLVFVLPHTLPENASSWFEQAGHSAGARSCSWVNGCAAAASAYGIRPAAGEIVLVVSFTGTEMAVTAALAGESGIQPAGQVSTPTGYLGVEGWIVQDLLERFRLRPGEPRAERIRTALVREAGRARELVPHERSYGIAVTDPVPGRTYTASYGTAELARVLDEHGMTTMFRDLLDRAVLLLRAKGLEQKQPAAILLTGPGCALPGIGGIVRGRFPGVPVHDGHLLDAYARGAVSCPAPARAPDRIRNSYALRYWDPAAREHHYRFLVPAGTRFPSLGQVARITISAAYDGQTHLGIPLCEIGTGRENGGIELVSDRAGGVHIAGPAQDAGEGSHAVLLNEQNPTLLVADPPAQKGEPRFECTFTIDRERNLCLSARDLVTGTLVKLNAPVYRLT